MNKRIGRHTVKLSMPPSIIGSYSYVGKKEGEGPLKHCFDRISNDMYFGEKSWEQAESKMMHNCLVGACDCANISTAQLDYLFAGDLLNQCVSSVIAVKDSDIPYFGLYGACSTMAEALSLGAMAIDGGYADNVCAMTGSHFCSAERQYRFPLEYGGQRTPSSQWTVTGAGAVILSASKSGPHLTHITTGCIKDAGICDPNSMGSAMAPAAYETIKAHFSETGRSPEYYDAIFTGDLGTLGRDIVQAMFLKDGIKLNERYMDCGVLIYDLNTQNVGTGGSGCGCSASVLSGHIIPAMKKGIWKKVLFAATGALMSTTTAQQGISIPAICHAISIENEV